MPNINLYINSLMLIILNQNTRKLLSLLLFSLTVLSVSAQDKKLTVATAANFAPVLKTFIPTFEQQHNIKINVISAATGTLYQQIIHGAPFDVFLSADGVRPQKLVEQGFAISDSMTTYTIGQLSFYSSTYPELTFQQFISNTEHIKRLAIANPSFAPYGIAAKQALEQSNIWEKLQRKLILGININQTFQQIRSQAATAGIIATSQLALHQLTGHPISASLYHPIQQKAVIVKSSNDIEHARLFINYLLSKPIQKQLSQLGYQPIKHSEMNRAMAL